MKQSRVWQSILNDIELNISKANFVTWFNNTYIYSVDGDRVVIAVPSGFSKEWLENKFHTQLLKYLTKYYPETKRIEYKIVSPGKPKQSKQKRENKEAPLLGEIRSANLNPRYNFQNLVVGEHNELAIAAGQAVVKQLGEKYNPLYVFGGVGLGKTHLIQAIGNEVLKNQPNSVVRYLTSEKFTSDFVNSIRNQTIEKFKQLYNSVDLLLIDDIQFIGGKEGTQEQFFHTFNNLYQKNRQIVICSDCPPRSIPALEERLCSRFEGGMIVDITKPDLETRVAILNKKAKLSGFEEVDQQAIEYIASSAVQNVRELEGYLNKLLANCQLKGINPSLQNTIELLGDDFSRIKQESSGPKGVLKTVADYYKLEVKSITGKGRKSEVVQPRQITIVLLRDKLKMPFEAIGKELGGRDHTTIMHGYNKVRKELKKDPLLKQDLDAIKEVLG
ncbi:MAG: chromosomal replication initiator protein DnaA [Candidatus Moranbacteria bacterium]|nr:chromosomal replication initiator protein DnaA [Candidatus Moranbacteria bacterium]